MKAHDFPSARAKADRIKELLQEGTYLLVLDGLEAMQKDVRDETFGAFNQWEMKELVSNIADVMEGLCLMISRYPFKDLEPWKGSSYQSKDIHGLEKGPALKLLRNKGVDATDEELEQLIENLKGHALSLHSLTFYLRKYCKNRIECVSDVRYEAGDEHRWKDVNKLLIKYAEQMTDAELVFMKIFSLFRTEVTDKEFKGVFQGLIIHAQDFNAALKKLDSHDFIDLVNGLVEWRMIAHDEQEDTYTIHPLVKNYFESMFDDANKKYVHRKIYFYLEDYAPKLPDTLEEMKPLFEQVYHGCKAGMQQSVLEDVFGPKISRGSEAYIINKLGAWETALRLLILFFQNGDLNSIPMLKDTSSQTYVLNNTGLTLQSIGNPLEAEHLFVKKTEMQIKDEDWENVCVGYQNLTDLRIVTGRIEEALETSQNALDISTRSTEKAEQGIAKAYKGYAHFLLGQLDEASDCFEDAAFDVQGTVGDLNFFIATYFVRIGDIDNALKAITKTLKLSKNYRLMNAKGISMCFLSMIERLKCNHERASEYIEEALEIARITGTRVYEIQALLERARLWLDKGEPDKTEIDINEAFKIVERTGFKLYEPDAEVVLAMMHMARGDNETACARANRAIELAVPMKYHWPQVDAKEILEELGCPSE